jgi:hypothetical protein
MSSLPWCIIYYYQPKATGGGFLIFEWTLPSLNCQATCNSMNNNYFQYLSGRLVGTDVKSDSYF